MTLTMIHPTILKVQTSIEISCKFLRALVGLPRNRRIGRKVVSTRLADILTEGETLSG